MTPEEHAPSLAEAFDLAEGEIVSIVGGGGKTSLMFALAADWNGPVISTSTTRIFRNQIKIPPLTLILGPSREANAHDIEALDKQLACFQHCLVIGGIEGDKAIGLPVDLPQILLKKSMAEIVIVESDGSRMRPCKAPAAHEPAIPFGSTLVIPTIGIDALNHRIADVAHRPERVAAITDLSPEDTITTGAMASIIKHPDGGLKNVPPGARVIPFINKVESKEQLAAAREIADQILREERIARVVIGSLRDALQVKEVNRRVTAVVLAAGKSDRMGKAKQLLPWGDKTILAQTLANLQSSRVDEILVVAGHEARAVRAIADRISVPTLINPDYESGEMLSSLQTAVGQLPNHQSAVLVVLADQPMITADIIDRLLERYYLGTNDLVAPVYRGQRGNPVLIGRSHFQELLNLAPGKAPRDLLLRHVDKLALVDVNSAAVIQDIDLPEDYHRWRPRP